MTQDSLATTRAYCPNCNDERVCLVHGETSKRWDGTDEASGGRWSCGSEHALLECRGCETVFYQDKVWTDDNYETKRNAEGREEIHPIKTVRTFPKLGRSAKPEWLEAILRKDIPLHTVLDQMYMAHENGARILTAIALRTAFDRAIEVLGIDAGGTFDEKLDALEKGRWIGGTERAILGVVTNAGNAAAHRGWEPDAEDIQHLLRSLESFMHRAFVVGQDALKISERIPARPKRRRATEEKPKRG